VPRVAVLWPETVEAIRAVPRLSDSLFVTEATRQPHNANTIGKYFRTLREEAGVPETVKFMHIRDGAYTAGCETEGVQYEHVRVLAGHRTGMSDRYVKRNPKLVASVCAAIRREYGTEQPPPPIRLTVLVAGVGEYEQFIARVAAGLVAAARSDRPLFPPPHVCHALSRFLDTRPAEWTLVDLIRRAEERAPASAPDRLKARSG
jgi:hypothetical protein